MNGLLTSIASQARARGDTPALRSRGRSLGYAQLMDCVNQAVSQLQSLQVESLGLYLDNGIDWVVYDLAALACGIRVVPLPMFFSAGQIAHAIVDAGLDAILFDQALPRGVSGTGVALPGLSDSRLQRIRMPAGGQAGTARGRQAGDAPRALKISYTSGTTGTPKGIELDLDFIEQTAVSVCNAIDYLDIDRHLGILPYATLLENIAGIYAPLMMGRCVHAEPSADVGLTPALGLDPQKLRACFERVRPNSLITTPQLLELLCQLSESKAISPDCLVFVAVGGARVAPALLQRARAAGIPAYEGYGLTEFASVATLNTPRNDRIGSVGKPLPGVTLLIAEDGEICVAREARRGAGPRKPKLVRTGDLGSVDDDGFVYLQGRKSNLIVMANGRNVAPEWIEAELNASSLINQSYVFCQGARRLAALLSSAASDARIEAEIHRINGELPAYARVQKWYRLPAPFSRERKTLTANGRLRRREIARQLPGLLAQRVAHTPIAAGQTLNRLQESKPC